MEPFSSTPTTPQKGISLFVAIVVALVLPALLNAASGAWMGNDMLQAFNEVADTYDEKYDPVTIRGGVVTAGPRRVNINEGGQLFLIDPDETIAVPEDVKNAVILRRTELIQIEPGKTEIHDIGELQEVLGLGDVVIDGPSMRAFASGYQWIAMIGMSLFFVIGGFIGDLVLLPICTAAGAGIATGVLSAEHVPYKQSVPMALLLGALTSIPRMLLWMIDIHPGMCIGLFLWPTLVVLGTTGFFAVRGPVQAG